MKISKIALMTMLAGACTGLWAGELFSDMCGTNDLLKKWGNSKVAQLLPNGGPEDKYAVKISSEDAKKSAMISFKIDPAQVKGKTLVLSADAKAEEVVVPSKKSYLGTKFMIFYKTKENKRKYAEGNVCQVRSGSFDWKKLTTKVKIPEDVVYISISIGLQEASGTVSFSNIQLSTEDAK